MINFPLDFYHKCGKENESLLVREWHRVIHRRYRWLFNIRVTRGVNKITISHRGVTRDEINMGI